MARVWRAYRRRSVCGRVLDAESVRIEERRAFEELLCLHCAPTFAGMKAASLISFQKAEYEDFDALMASYMPCFHCVGLQVYRLSDSEDRALVLIYRPGLRKMGSSIDSCQAVRRDCNWSRISR